jgi:hypothetical protein
MTCDRLWAILEGHFICNIPYNFYMAHFTDFPKGVSVMVFNSTFYKISVISWQSVLLVEETGVSSENQQPVASH